MVAIIRFKRKEWKMILDINKTFKGYSLIGEVYTMGNPYREIYEAEHQILGKCFLTVYDLRYTNMEDIVEFDMVSKLYNSIFPNCLDIGMEKSDGRGVCYMASGYYEWKDADGVPYHYKVDEENAVHVILQILTGLKEIMDLTGGGGHYNISPTTVLLSKTKNGRFDAHITNLEHISEPCCGKPDFNTKTIHPCFRAPETFLGKFSSVSDVYSVGVLLAYMIQGDNPYPIKAYMKDTEIRNVIKEGKMRLNVSERLMPFIAKAISFNSSKRFKNVEEMRIALMELMGNKKPKSFESIDQEFINELHKHLKENMDRVNNIKENIHFTDNPQLDVEMSVKKGDGFKAVAGMEEIKHKLRRDFVDIVTHRDLAKQFNIMPSNIIFYGPPGTGKTFISERLAEECGFDYCYVKPSDLGSIYIHGSQGLIKELFRKATKKAKANKKGCILLIDEIDALCGRRDDRTRQNTSDEVAEWLTQLNNCAEHNVFVIGTTNSLERIDRAVIRHGRIDQIFYIGLPDIECRRKLFCMELEKRPHDNNIDTEELAKITEGYTSSDICYMVKETARYAFEECITNEDNKIVKISEKMLRKVIAETHPSVTHNELQEYEKYMNEFMRSAKTEKRRIGFIT